MSFRLASISQKYLAKRCWESGLIFYPVLNILETNFSSGNILFMFAQEYSLRLEDKRSKNSVHFSFLKINFNN